MAKNKQKPKPLKKSELLEELYELLDDNHWNLITQIIGREIKSNKSSRMNFLGSILKKTIAVSSRRGKGQVLQKWVAEQISKLTGIPYGKDEEITPRESGQQGTDVRLSKRVLKKFAYSVECKNQETWSLPEFIRQAKANQLPNTEWLLFLTKNGHEEICVIDGLVFFNILKDKKVG